ncbi:P-loop containing nucleoside triphosphate hydrolase protein [Mycena metata]|uniref:RNA helicase n=1 Tax=Mycena metata TaxID=1033252 RepID=A0AAD7IVU0_9AGAR|nr:P-loop containing nucleoside triphosphate hydrolase protein [Mycena metata]
MTNRSTDSTPTSVTRDRDQNSISTGGIILDEIHERTLASGLLMALLKGLLKTRADLYQKLQKYWDAPLFKILGRLFPVEPDYLKASTRTILMIHCVLGPLTCIPLYGSLPLEQQRRIHDPPSPPRSIHGPPGRKVILATNIAEASLTIDGVVYVIDPGFSKQSVYNPHIRVESHLVSPISKASAQQRAGRAGRTRPGKCFRLYTEKDFVSELDEHPHPEIVRSNLSSMVLILAMLGVEDLVRFDYVDAPAPETLMRAFELLNYLAALDDNGNLTSLGAAMAKFPVEPQLAKMLIVNPKFKCSSEILTLAAMLSVPLIWRRSIHRRREADAAKAQLTVPGGDSLTLLNVYKQYKAILDVADKDWAHSHYLSLEALSQADKVRHQLERIMESLEIELISIANPSKLATAIRQALVCGFLMQVAHKEGGRGHYMTVKDQQVVTLHPSCVLGTQPEWVIFNEFVVTSRPYIRTVTLLVKVSPTSQWLHFLNDPLILKLPKWVLDSNLPKYYVCITSSSAACLFLPVCSRSRAG